MSAHPVGCDKEVERQINYVKSHGAFNGPKKVLVIGSSTGFGLATRITTAFGSGASTIGVAFEKEGSGKRPGTAGWYNTAAFERYAKEAGLYAKSFNGDAFSHEMKAEVINAIKADLGKVDLVVYSLASGIRVDPDTGETYRSVLKTLGDSYSAKSIDPIKGEVKLAVIEPANEEEVIATKKVMGGEDWELWVNALLEADVLETGAKIIAYSYIGPKVTHAIYRNGTIGQAKKHLEDTADKIRELMTKVNGEAYISVNKALVTRASSVIPVVSLYTGILYKVMKEKGLHEACIEQMYRMLSDKIYGSDAVKIDEDKMIRMDDWELRDDVQQAVEDIWSQIKDDNLEELTDLEGFRTEFMNQNGFDIPGVDYDADVEI